MAKPGTDDRQNRDLKEDQKIDQMIAQAVEAVARGESPEQVQEVMLESLPAAAKEKVRKKLAAALAKRKLKLPAEVADIPSKGTLARLRNMFSQSARQAADRIMALVRQRPDVAASIAQAGKILIKNGVVVDRVQVSEANLGTMAPAAGVKVQPDRGAGRGA